MQAGAELRDPLMIRVFIGYSRAAPVASSVAALSINRRASQPVAITHLALNQLQGIYTRPRHELQSTDFSFSRFLTPDRKSTRLNSSHVKISYAVVCL